jgi:hypothetical protein
MKPKLFIPFVLMFLFFNLILAQESKDSTYNTVKAGFVWENIHLDLIPDLFINDASLITDISFLRFKNESFNFRTGVDCFHVVHFAIDGGSDVKESPFLDYNALIVFTNGRNNPLMIDFYAGYSLRTSIPNKPDNYPKHILKYGLEISWMFYEPYIGLQLKICLAKRDVHDIAGLGFTFGLTK